MGSAPAPGAVFRALAENPCGLGKCLNASPVASAIRLDVRRVRRQPRAGELPSSYYWLLQGDWESLARCNGKDNMKE